MFPITEPQFNFLLVFGKILFLLKFLNFKLFELFRISCSMEFIMRAESLLRDNELILKPFLYINSLLFVYIDGENNYFKSCQFPLIYFQSLIFAVLRAAISGTLFILFWITVKRYFQALYLNRFDVFSICVSCKLIIYLILKPKVSLSNEFIFYDFPASPTDQLFTNFPNLHVHWTKTSKHHMLI